MKVVFSADYDTLRQASEQRIAALVAQNNKLRKFYLDESGRY
jgi:hypothetical protein